MKNLKGKLFTTTGDDVWRLAAYIEEPTVIMENMATAAKKPLTVSQANERFVQLVPKGKLPQIKEMDYVPALPDSE